jgi:hypothetical protein
MFGSLFRLRKRLKQVHTLMSWGIVYAAFERHFWYFELFELAQKVCHFIVFALLYPVLCVDLTLCNLLTLRTAVFDQCSILLPYTALAVRSRRCVLCAVFDLDFVGQPFCAPHRWTACICGANSFAAHFGDGIGGAGERLCRWYAAQPYIRCTVLQFSFSFVLCCAVLCCVVLCDDCVQVLLKTKLLQLCCSSSYSFWCVWC